MTDKTLTPAEVAAIREYAEQLAPDNIMGANAGTVVALCDAVDAQADEIARLRAALEEARHKGLIYWEPNTERGHVAKALMLARIDALIGETSDGPYWSSPDDPPIEDQVSQSGMGSD